MRILVIEDNKDLAENIADYFEGKNHSLNFAYDGLTGMHLAVTEEQDVIVLDLTLPGIDGLDVCRRLRQEAKNAVPILMLTARDTLEDKLAGFDAGADDYLIKPFALKELEARLVALTRRIFKGEGRILETGTLRVDTGRRSVTRNGKPVTLNKTGYRILTELMSRAPDVVSRSDLEHLLWGDMPPGSDALRSHIYALRKALDAGKEPSVIETVHGVGFRILRS